MRPLSKLPAEVARSMRGLLFDLDDTFLSHGTLERAAYDALWDLHDAKVPLVVVTGRPSGWGEVIVRQWPVDAVVTENGAVIVVREGRGIRIVEECSATEREERRARLEKIVLRVRSEMPEVELSDDVHMRRSDVTWDIGERVVLPPDRVARLSEIVIESGARTTSSSVHLHATFDTSDKASGAIRLLRSMGEDEGRAVARWAFVGDSGNDRACFAAFHITFGVSNVRIGQLSLPPRWVASEPMGRGFAEISRAILAHRRER